MLIKKGNFILRVRVAVWATRIFVATLSVSGLVFRLFAVFLRQIMGKTKRMELSRIVSLIVVPEVEGDVRTRRDVD